jgi:CBS domain-containing protein
MNDNTTSADRVVRDVMHTGVVSCTLETPIRQVIRSMEENNIHALVVVDEAGFLAGVISQTDVVHARMIKPDWGTWEDLPAGRLMTPYAVTVRPDEPEQNAIRKLAENNIHRLVVVEGEHGKQRPVGIVSMTDLVRQMSD